MVIHLLRAALNLYLCRHFLDRTVSGYEVLLLCGIDIYTEHLVHGGDAVEIDIGLGRARRGIVLCRYHGIEQRVLVFYLDSESVGQTSAELAVNMVYVLLDTLARLSLIIEALGCYTEARPLTVAPYSDLFILLYIRYCILIIESIER